MSGTRPSVSVVMPFAGPPAAARAARVRLAGLRLADGDERILADNTGTAGDAAAPGPAQDEVRVLAAPGERSAAHARNVGAAAASGEWLLFLDADTDPPGDLLARYLAEPVADDVGALAGGIDAAPTGDSLAARYAAARGFLDADVHLAHPYLPRAASANLLVRTAAFRALGGFAEGVRAAEDTDLCWRLQRAGWRLQARPEARVAHRYRESLSQLRRQWRGYAAGRAWLARRYPDFRPEPALARAVRRALAGVAGPTAAGSSPPRRGGRPPGPGRGARALRFVDVVLGVEELVGFVLTNRAAGAPARPPAARVWVAARSSLHVALAPGDRVEAIGRPEALSAPDPRVTYGEDDGALARAAAVLDLFVAHPARVRHDRALRVPGGPSLAALAPAGRRIAADRAAVVRAATPAELPLARRLAALAGRPSPS